MKAKIAVLGKDSRLGAALKWADISAKQCEFFGREHFDLSNPTALEIFCRSGKWDAVVLAAAATDVDWCETHPDEAWIINARAPEIMARALPRQTRFIFMSTDFVFDGEQCHPYEESAAPNALSVYGKAKQDAEQSVLAASAGNLVIRSSWLFGGGKPSLPDIMIGRACQQSALEIVADRWASPTSASDLAVAVLALSNTGATGIVHYCNSGVCTPFEYVSWAIECARSQGRPIVAETLTPIPATNGRVFAAARPTYSALETQRYQKLIGQEPRPWQEALEEHLAGATVPSRSRVRRTDAVPCALKRSA